MGVISAPGRKAAFCVKMPASMGSTRLLAVLFALVLVSGAARAQSSDDLARAKTHYEAGHALYNLGNFTEAQREFAAGYQLVPRPGFLLNLGQCARKLGNLERAQEMYQRFLQAARPDDPQRAEATQVLAELDKQIAERPAAVAVAPEPQPPATTVGAPTAPAVAPAALTLTAAPPRRKSWIKRNWWVVPVAAVVVAGGVGLGIYFGTRPAGACKSGDLACWDLSKSQ
jgi:tetratricopeptide (TPR) repeat protein